MTALLTSSLRLSPPHPHPHPTNEAHFSQLYQDPNFMTTGKRWNINRALLFDSILSSLRLTNATSSLLRMGPWSVFHSILWARCPETWTPPPEANTSHICLYWSFILLYFLKLGFSPSFVFIHVCCFLPLLLCHQQPLSELRSMALCWMYWQDKVVLLNSVSLSWRSPGGKNEREREILEEWFYIYSCRCTIFMHLWGDKAVNRYVHYTLNWHLNTCCYSFRCDTVKLYKCKNINSSSSVSSFNH